MCAYSLTQGRITTVVGSLVAMGAQKGDIKTN